MEYFRFKIYPESQFGNTPMSDTIFGQLCCMLARDGVLDTMLVDYDKKPFAVFSDMVPLDKGRKLILQPKTAITGSKAERIGVLKTRKDDKKNDHILISNILKGEYKGERLFSDSEESFATHEVIKNSINRNTGGTDGEGFAPHSMINTSFSDKFYYTLYAFIEKQYVEAVISALKLMGSFGFGRDSSTGLGRFRVEEITTIQIPTPESCNVLYTLGNSVLDGVSSKDAYYEPFTRFGKHGGERVIEGRPYKNPIVMARQGALIFTDIIPATTYIGNGITSGVSYYYDTVHQGYSLYIPMRIEL